jgi:hypothetical protein
MILARMVRSMARPTLPLGDVSTNALGMNEHRLLGVVLLFAADAACSDSNQMQERRGDPGLADSDAGADARTAGQADATSIDGAGETGPQIAAPTPEASPSDDAAPDAASPISGLPTELWAWVPFAGSRCRDGSSTGIGVNFNPSSNKVMIFLEGGGACFNETTCVTLKNPSSFGEADFAKRAASSLDKFGLNVGIMDRSQAANPARDWSYVYIPYCTGDAHEGNNVASVQGVGTETFAGYTNLQQYLARIALTFPGVSTVLFAGISAGGLGAEVAYALAASAFGATPVIMLDDSGPFMEDPYLAACQQAQVETLWGLAGTAFAGCGTACATSATLFLGLAQDLISQHPNVTFGLADSLNDGTISQFYGFGYQNCTGYQQLTAAQFTAGLLDIRTKLAAYPNFGEFLFPGTDHTSLQSAAFYTRTAGGSDAGADAGGMLMTEWVASLLASRAVNVGP